MSASMSASMVNVGAAIIDITPPAGLAMAGFAARSDPASGAHDPLTARALVVEDTAFVTVDVIGISADLSKRARSRASLPDQSITIAATHTHGGPVSMPGRLWAEADSGVMEQLETAIPQAIDAAASRRKPARVLGGTGVEPGFAKNRRRDGGPVDQGVPVLRFEDKDGAPIAILASYACHPVVLGPDNLAWTGDYPHFVREALEAANPGAIALFATGCAGDVNTGHSAASSLTNQARADRSFAMARTVGQSIAQAAIKAEMKPIKGAVSAAEIVSEISFEQRETGTPETLAEAWQAEAWQAEAWSAKSGPAKSGSAKSGSIKPEQAKPGLAKAADPNILYLIWANWARTIMGKAITPCPARCTALHWCGAEIIALPGEIFAETALDLRQWAGESGAPLFLVAYSDDNPGYIPPLDDYARGGYEVEEAHRFYGLGATVAPGTAERLADAGRKAAGMARMLAGRTQSFKTNMTERSKL